MDFKNQFLGEWAAWDEETNIQCPECGCPHMNNNGVTGDGYPKFKCGNCRKQIDKSPKNQALRDNIDRYYENKKNPNIYR